MSNPLQPLQETKVEADLTRKILRGINDTVRLLDDLRGRAQIVVHLFSPAARVLRSKLHELCFRYIWIDPAINGKRGEETLWKKAYHDVFVAAKRLKKEGDVWDDEESALVQGLLLSGIGYYQHLIFRLQADNVLHIDGVSDFSMTISDDGLDKGKISSGRADEAPWADEMASHCLLNMGDLWRYMRDLEPGWDLRVAERHYMQAAWLTATDGRPYNQLATLESGRNYYLNAVYYYMRSVSCVTPFPGAEGNLNRILEKNWNSLELEPLGPVPSCLAQRVIMRFLLLVEVWFSGKTVDNLQTYCFEVVEGFQQLMQQNSKLLKTIEKNTDTKVLFSYSEPTNNIPTATIIKMFAVLFMCWRKVYTNESVHQTAITATLLSLVDAVTQEIIAQFEASQALQKKMRGRRRRRRIDSDGSSSGADSPADDDVDSGDSPEVSSCDEGETNGHGGTSGSTSAKKLNESKIPLPEEASLRGAPGLEAHHNILDWSLVNCSLSRQEIITLRACRLLAFANQLSVIRFDKINHTFHCIEEVKLGVTPPPNEKECKGKLMKNMGQLWLKAEVKELENRIKKVNGTDYTPYLVVDFEALTEHIVHIKQIVGSRQFIVVIPSAVLTQLDEFKKSSGKARETIRWLESQFLHGNRHLRSQKVQERVSLGVIKYPKKKDKDAWNFFQMMECCAYLSKQSELRSKAGTNVTFLTGSKDKIVSDIRQHSNGQDFSPSGLAGTFGVTLEHVETFHSKWKLSCKSHG